MDLLYQQVFSVSLTLFLCALMCSGVSGQRIWLNSINNKLHFDSDAVICQNGYGIVITDVGLQWKGCSNKTLERVIKAAVRRDCSGKRKCGTRNVSNFLKKSECGDGSSPLTRISLIHECKPFDLKASSRQVLDMCGGVERTFPNNNINISLVLRSNSTVYRRCVLRARESDKNITLKTLQVDFGEQCDNMENCEGVMNIFVNSIDKAQLQKLVEKSMSLSGSEFEINVHLPAGLLWLELQINKNDTINCTENATNCSVGDTDDEEDNREKNRPDKNDKNDDSTRNVIVIGTSLAAVIATIVVICLCAVFLCRVRRKRSENLQQNEVQYKPEEAYDYVTLDKDKKVSTENGVYDRAKQFPSGETNYLIAGDNHVGDTYSKVNKVNKVNNPVAASHVCPMNSSEGASKSVTPDVVSDVDEYSHLGHFKGGTWNTENVYDG